MKPILAIPAISLLVHRAWSRKSLTPLGLITAALTAVAHAVHPWSAPFSLLVAFYIGGTKATKVKHDIKASKTLSATGSGGGDSQRNHIQVLANSIVATVLIMWHTWILKGSGEGFDGFSFGRVTPLADVVMVGIVANYAAVAADTYSSELGILSKSPPRLITSLSLRVVPPGTNGGVTATGLQAGVLGAFTVAVTSAVLLPFRLPGSDDGLYVKERLVWILAVTGWGALGSVLDSVLGGLLQASVVDKRTGKVVEGTGGKKVLVHPSSSLPGGTSEASSGLQGSSDNLRLRQTETVANTAALRGSRVTQSSVGASPGREHDEEHESRRVESGRDWLDNNGVNVLMAGLMSLGGMGTASLLWM
ncbi:DUF92 domain-containing protein [Aspergillus ruber CBS 135680]|uniref:Integral membrane protein DUF92-domain-containing protein n=1 Tax=Aspergillus ruber (strain CBS 135680) TaxID=1388766 RepID=A0A017SJ30_ASPRC|nr:uncharacterized protein EURHEDRAFT_411163 [Aspergillus ruber CBS 135680]EYE96654.1 hypothetical protein EURHEDRAFT_411163 [Aspergillus ruber CBS 135680]